MAQRDHLLIWRAICWAQRNCDGFYFCVCENCYRRSKQFDCYCCWQSNLFIVCMVSFGWNTFSAYNNHTTVNYKSTLIEQSISSNLIHNLSKYQSTNGWHMPSYHPIGIVACNFYFLCEPILIVEWIWRFMKYVIYKIFDKNKNQNMQISRNAKQNSSIKARWVNMPCTHLRLNLTWVTTMPEAIALLCGNTKVDSHIDFMYECMCVRLQTANPFTCWNKDYDRCFLCLLYFYQRDSFQRKNVKWYLSKQKSHR